MNAETNSTLPTDELLKELRAVGSNPGSTHRIMMVTANAVLKIESLFRALQAIADMEDESNEWDGAAKYTEARNKAQEALK